MKTIESKEGEKGGREGRKEVREGGSEKERRNPNNVSLIVCSKKTNGHRRKFLMVFRLESFQSTNGFQCVRLRKN